jgi:hypothetical protein
VRARARAPARPRKFRGEPARGADQAVGRGGNIGERSELRHIPAQVRWP